MTIPEALQRWRAPWRGGDTKPVQFRLSPTDLDRLAYIQAALDNRPKEWHTFTRTDALRAALEIVGEAVKP